MNVNECLVFRGREHSEVSIPLQLLLQEGALNLFEEIKGRKYFHIYSRGADLVFQCGSFIGLIPINEHVAIDVAPRVEISNLDWMFNKVGAQHTLLTLIQRGYAATAEANYLVNLLADALLASLDDIAEWGRYKEYDRVVYFGQPRSGRILINDTLRLRARHPGLPLAATTRFERSANNLFNFCIKLAIERVLSLLQQAPGKKLEWQRISKLNAGWLSFRDVEYSGDPASVANETNRRLSDAASLPLPYRVALPLATAILLSMGPSQRNLPPSFSLGSLIFDLSDVFEHYVRKCMSEWSVSPVLDGNTAKPMGAKKLFFDRSTHPDSRSVPATPDIVISTPDGKGISAVADAKYKPYKGMPSREDINQVLSYAISYGASKCALIYPSTSGRSSVERFGYVGAVEVFGFSMNLAAHNLADEERAFAEITLAAVGAPIRRELSVSGEQNRG